MINVYCIELIVFVPLIITGGEASNGVESSATADKSTGVTNGLLFFHILNYFISAIHMNVYAYLQAVPVYLIVPPPGHN